MDVADYLYSKGWQWKTANRSSGVFAIMDCPFCEDTKKHFAVNLTTGSWRCMRTGCPGGSGTFKQLQYSQGDRPMAADSPKNFVPVAKKKDYVRPAMPTSLLDGRGLKWIEDNRKLTKGTIEYFDVRMNERGTGLCWPYYKDGVLVNLKHRAFATKQFYNSKDSEPCLFNRDRCADNLERLIICEGEFDCMALHQYGIEAVSVPNGTGG